MNLGNFKAYFYVRSSINLKNKKEDLVPVYLRIEKNRKRKDLSTNVYGPKELWNGNHKRFDGKSASVKRANNELGKWDQKVETVYSQLVRLNSEIELDQFYEHISGKYQVPMLVSTFAQRLKAIEKLIGSDYTKSTLTTYEVAFKHLKGFLKVEGKEDIALRDVSVGFLNDFQSYLNKRMTNNSTNKNMRKLKAVLNNAALNDNFDGYKLKKIKLKDEEVVREFLTEAELMLIANKHFSIQRISAVRDIFLFQCYTGLAYADIKELNKDHLIKGSGRVFVCKQRVKTKIKATIPLVEQAHHLLEKYDGKSPKGDCFPIPSNQKFNAYLQEVADLCGIIKPLTSHIARHTFATRMLNNGMHKDIIQEIMGLSSSKHLNIYAKMQHETLYKEMMKANVNANVS